MKRFSKLRAAVLLAAIAAALFYGVAAITSFPIIVIADSDLGAGAMEHVHDGMVLFLFSVGAIVVVCRVIPLSRLRIAIALTLILALAGWRFKSTDTAQSARWPLMGILGLVIVAESVEGRRRNRTTYLALAVLLPCMLVVTDWQGRIYWGLFPPRSEARQIDQPGLRTSIGLMDEASYQARAPVSRLVATGTKDGTLSLQGMDGGKPIVLPASATDRMLEVLCFSPDGRTLAVADNDRMYVGSLITIWDVAPGKGDTPPKITLRHALAGPKHWTFSMDIFPDGRTLVAANGDNTIRLWDLVTGKELSQFVAHQNPRGPWDQNADCVAVTPDGKAFATWAWSGLKLWDRNSLKLLRELDTQGQCPCSIAFTADSRQLIATDRAGTRFWDLWPSPIPVVVLLGCNALIIGWIVWALAKLILLGDIEPLSRRPGLGPIKPN